MCNDDKPWLRCPFQMLVAELGTLVTTCLYLSCKQMSSDTATHDFDIESSAIMLAGPYFYVLRLDTL